MKHDEFLDLSGISRDSQGVSFDTHCLLHPDLIAFAKDWLNATSKPSLILQGVPGSGKTFFSIALLQELWKQLQPNPFIIFKMGTRLDAELLDAMLGKSSCSAADIIRTCSESRALFIDDFGLERSSERVQRQYFDVLNPRITQNRVTVVSTNCSMRELRDKFGERIYSRLKGFKLVKFPEVDLREGLQAKRSQS